MPPVNPLVRFSGHFLADTIAHPEWCPQLPIPVRHASHGMDVKPRARRISPRTEFKNGGRGGGDGGRPEAPFPVFLPVMAGERIVS